MVSASKSKASTNFYRRNLTWILVNLHLRIIGSTSTFTSQIKCTSAQKSQTLQFTSTTTTPRVSTTSKMLKCLLWSFTLGMIQSLTSTACPFSHACRMRILSWGLLIGGAMSSTTRGVTLKRGSLTTCGDS